MKDALEAKKRSVEWMPLSREGHGAYDESVRLEVSQRVLAFLDKHLK